MDDLIRLLEARRRQYNDAIDRAIRALRSAPAGEPGMPGPARPRGRPRSTDRRRERPARRGRQVTQPAAPPNAANAGVVPGSLLDRASVVLRQRGRLHVRDIVTALGLGADKKQTVVSALERGIPRGVVRRPLPGTYEAVT